MLEALRSNDSDNYHQTYIAHLLAYFNSEGANKTLEDFRQPFIKLSLRYVYPLFILLHAVVVIGGVCGNTAMLWVIIRRRLYRNPTYFFLANLAFSDLLKAGIVLPITVTTMLLENWIFGSFLCFFLPMMHSFPIHASMLTYLVIGIDRYRLIVHPMKSRVPAGLCLVTTWVVGVCAVLPFAVFIEYTDLSRYGGSDLEGVGICWINMSKNIQEYIRATFIIMYCQPLAIMAFLYVKVSAEIKASQTPSVSVHQEEVSPNEGSYQTHITWSASDQDEASSSQLQFVDPEREGTVELDYRREKRTQKYFITMVMCFAVCWCPLNIMTLVNHFVLENDDNSGHLDITYLTFTVFGFMSTCCSPVLFASWAMSNQAKDRLKDYLRFSNRRQSCLSASLSPAAHRRRQQQQHQKMRADNQAAGDMNFLKT